MGWGGLPLCSPCPAAALPAVVSAPSVHPRAGCAPAGPAWPQLSPHPHPFFPTDPVGETLFKDGKSQAWGSLNPSVQKGKNPPTLSPLRVPGTRPSPWDPLAAGTPGALSPLHVPSTGASHMGHDALVLAASGWGYFTGS